MKNCQLKNIHSYVNSILNLIAYSFISIILISCTAKVDLSEEAVSSLNTTTSTAASANNNSSESDSGSSEETAQEEVVSFSWPSQYYAKQSDSFTLSINSIDSLLVTDLTQNSTGNASCVISSTNNKVGETAAYFTLTNCTGNGRVSFTYDGKTSSEVYIDNTDDQIIGSGNALALSPSRTDIYVLDKELKAVVKINISTGLRTTISSPTVGGGSTFNDPKDIIINSNETIAYVSDQRGSYGAIFSVDLSNGNRTIVSDRATGTGSGPDLDNVTSIVLNTSENSIYVLDGVFIYSVYLSNGNRALVTDGSVSEPGQTFGNVVKLALSSSDDLFAIDRLNGMQTIRIFSIDKGSGNRTYSDYDLSTNSIPVDDTITFDVNSNRVYALTDTSNTLYVLNTQTRSVVEIQGPPDRILMGNVFAITHDPASQRVYFLDDRYQGVLTTDVNSQLTSIISTSLKGQGYIGTFGNKQRAPTRVIINTDETIAYISEISFDSIYQVDLTSGDKTLLSNNFSNPSGIYLNNAEDTLYIVDSSNDNLVSMNIATREITVISSDIIGSGPTFNDPVGVVLNSDETIAYVSDAGANAVYEVDLSTGARSEITGTGQLLVNPGDIDIDANDNKIYVAESMYNDIVEIDISTGNRTPANVGTVGLDPVGVVNASNELYATCRSNRALYLVNKGSTLVSTISDSANGTGHDFFLINGAAAARKVDNPSNIYIVDQIQGILFRVDVATGNRTIVSN